MQQGDWPVYPVGQLVPKPPKHRGMPAPSSLQTSFKPLQQFCDALMLPPSGSTLAPQMLPTGLQAVPLSQRLPVQVTLPLGLVPPPQHSCAVSQVLPVSRHPLAGRHTFAPEPTSAHRREQQLEPPVQGLPSCVQPPVTLQRPTPPSLTEQRLLQHAALLEQMSLVAWQLEAGAQKPPLQLVEQHCDPSVQA